MIQNTLFAKYLSEREGKRIIEDERGFIVYKVQGEECFIAELFVDESARGGSAFTDLLRHLSAEAKSEGCKVLTGNISLGAPGAMRVLAASLKRGFRVGAAEGGVLLMIKEV